MPRRYDPNALSRGPAVQLRFRSHAERDALKRAAQRAGMPLAAWLRAVSLAAAEHTATDATAAPEAATD